MKCKKYLSLLFNVLLFSLSVVSQQERIVKGVLLDSIGTKAPTLSNAQNSKLIKYSGADGPYVVNDVLYRVDKKSQFIKQNPFKSDSILVETDNEFADEFYVTLAEEYKIPKSTYPLPKKLVAISDIEGNYNAFSGFLFSNNIIDKNHNWIFADGHLVLVGDFIDRGKNVTQVLWLIYKLEQQAKNNGGRVHFILGNHEVLNFQGHGKYNQGKYIKVAQQISGKKNINEAIKFMYSDKTELGRWMQTKNVIEKIGTYIFTHGGLSADLIEYDLSIDDINSLFRMKYADEISKQDITVQFLYGSKGPIWYRGMVRSNPKYTKATNDDILKILSFYKAEKVVVGHTIVSKITKGFHGAVIVLDVPHGHQKFSGRTKGLLIDEGKEFIIDDLGSIVLFE